MFTSPIPRVEAPGVADERTALNAFLDFQRATALQKMNGLSDEDLRRSVGPAGLTLLGLVKHLTLVEQWWFAINFSGSDEEQIYADENDDDADMKVRPDETTDQIVSAYLSACERSRELVAAAPSLDVRVTTRRGREIDLRWIMLHCIEEYARHNGHADIIRELIDGATGI